MTLFNHSIEYDLHVFSNKLEFNSQYEIEDTLLISSNKGRFSLKSKSTSKKHILEVYSSRDLLINQTHEDAAIYKTERFYFIIK